ncbi:MAG: DUF1538 domain-containing protein [Treponema sp.]|jgi:hypothetical protein|nr:DUF1538 domain-containing protein [Treponema sp.]
MLVKKRSKNRFPPRGQDLIVLPLNRALPMVGSYAFQKIRPQFRAVLLVSAYLIAAQYLVLRTPLQNALSIAAGVGAAILGLSFFLEGLLLGIMPLGEQCGMRLPAKIGAAGLTVFSIIVGITATLAEPAIAILRQQGSVIPPWNAPLLYLLLNRGSSWLVSAIAAGVGLSVVLGVYRFMFGWAFKPPVFIIIPLLVAASCIFDENDILRPVVNLAWDTGGAATGAVTVPIILALGLGVSKTGEKRSDSSGLGLVTLASALPVAGVLLLAALLSPRVPEPSGPADFFSSSPEQRAKALYVAGGEEGLVKMAEAALLSGDLPPDGFNAAFPGREVPAPEGNAGGKASVFSFRALLEYLKAAVVAVLPLALALVIAIAFIARDRIRNPDVAVLGIVFVTVGMFALNLGMEGGITAISSQAGSSLTYTYREVSDMEKALVVEGADESSIFTVPGGSGPEEYIWIPGEKGPKPEKFVPERMVNGIYTHIPVKSSLFSNFGRPAAYLGILVFVFFLGFFAIFAEPALAATAVTVEEMTTGTFKRSKLVMNAAVGVGIGMSLGFARVLFSNLLPAGGIHLSWILAPAYLLALILTAFAPEDFSSIAWDVAGIATGPISVPIIITTGLGLGADSLRADGAFGIVATASVIPIIAVLVPGIIDKQKSKRAIKG